MEFSIIIPTYNRAELIKKTIDSCLNQDFLGLYEIIVVDDGSTDNTLSVIESFQSSKIKYFKKENEERGKARNFGVSKSSGTWITFLDSDDTLLINHLSAAKFFITTKQELTVFHQGYVVKDTSGKTLLKSPTFISNVNQSLLEGNIISCIGVFLHHSVMKTYKFNEDRNFNNGEDWLLWLQIAQEHTWYFNPIITATALHHSKRSTYLFDENNLNYCRKKLISELRKIANLKNYCEKINAHMLSYTSLRAVMSKNKIASINYLIEAIRTNFAELFKLRTLAIIKLLLFS